MQKKKVAIITNIPSPYRVDFFDFLQKNYGDYEFFIIYSNRQNKSRQWHIDESKMNNYTYLKSKRIKIKYRYDDRDIIISYGVEKVLKKYAPDVVVSMEYNVTSLFAMHWCKKTRTKYISWTDGTLHSERNIGKLQKIFRKYIVSRADAFIGSSTKSQETQIAYGADKKDCFISYLTVDIDKYIHKKTTYSNKKLVYVGGMIQRKGLDLLLPAIALTREDITLDIVGNGAEKEELEAQAKKLGIENRIRFRGFLEGEELRRCYAESDAFVLPTREDCFGLVILEAMCAGLPVIASKYADGAYDLIEEGRNGCIADPYDARAFAQAIETVLESPEKTRELGSYGYSRIEDFRFQEVAKGYLAAIDYAINKMEA